MTVGAEYLIVELSGFEKYRRAEVYLVPRQRVTVDIALSLVPQGQSINALATYFMTRN